MKLKPNALFLSHGGGPLPLLGDQGHQEMVDCLEQIAAIIPKPSALVVVSAHWEESIPVISAGKNPSLIYDYYGFPAESYTIEYPCRGDPSLAAEIHQLLNHSGISARLEEQRGFDHGVFVPLKIMYPKADIPCVQLSLIGSLDPADHIAMGRALQPLRDRDVLLIGSGFSFHNLNAFRAPDGGEAGRLNRAFEAWLQDTCCNTEVTEAERMQRLIRWSEAPGARFCHPREEHLLPLHVCYGLAQAPCSTWFTLNIMNKQCGICLW